MRKRAVSAIGVALLFLACSAESACSAENGFDTVIDPATDPPPNTPPALAAQVPAAGSLDVTLTADTGAANDVVVSFARQWDTQHPLHKGRTSVFEFFASLFGGYLNPPPA